MLIVLILRPLQNDWRALAAALRLEGSTAFFSLRKSPTECVVTLWEVQR